MNWNQEIVAKWANYELRSQREPICKSCEKLGHMNICKECYCYTPLKTLWAKESCPLGKWHSINIE